MTHPSVRYPPGLITPHGAYHFLRGDIPMMVYRSFDDTVVFNLMGGPAIPDRTQPESVRLKELRGLIPPWKQITQKGATQDGSSYITTLYDPMEVDMVLEVVGRDREHCRQVWRDWIAAWDAKRPGELSFFTPQLGRWWAEVHWSKNPTDGITGGDFRTQKATWSATSYDAFWRSYDCVDEFRFSYTSSTDIFDYTTASELGAGWTVAYSGAGTGIIYADGAQVVPTLAGGKTAACRRVGFTTTTNSQVVELQIGVLSQWFFDTTTFVDLWARMADTGTPGDDGIRLRIYHSTIRLSSFDGGVETVMREQYLFIPVWSATVFTLIAGFQGDERMFKVLRDGALVMQVTESGTGSQLGAGFRSVGFGLSATGTVVPATVRWWRAGDNNTVAQEGFVSLTNVGDQDMWPRFTCFGPGTFNFGNGPGSSQYVSFGPLLANQVAQIRTNPEKQSVVDLTSIPPSPQELTIWQQAIKDFISFASGNNVPPLLQAIESLFGIQPPQANMYSLLDGRFSVPIPPKPAGTAAVPYHISVSIDDGNADSKIIAAGTPLRRFPW